MDQTTGGCPTYESWTVRREPWLPPFGLERRHDRNRESTGRFEDARADEGEGAG
jgi:hypothetical protein